MKKVVTLFAALFSFAAVFAAPTITGISAIPRGVRDGKIDVEVSLTGTLDEVAKVILTFTATDTSDNSNLPVSHIEQQGEDVGSGTSWTRKFVWDARSDVGEVKIDNVMLSVKGEIPVGGVQLWEGGPYFAECNVGATKPEESGYYFWWGDTVGYKRNSANNGWMSVKNGASYEFSLSACPTYDKSVAQIIAAGYIDSSGNLVAEHDAATSYMGEPWRMPTGTEMEAIKNSCTTKLTSRNGIAGLLVAGKGNYSSQTIFLPASGYGFEKDNLYRGENGRYWSSSVKEDSGSSSMNLYFFNSDIYYYGRSRYYGQSVRPVRNTDQSAIVIDCVETHFAVDTRSLQIPVFTPKCGAIFSETLTVSISCASEGATIHYTTDGSEPTMETTQYTKRFRISGKTTIKARAFYEDGTGSEIVTAEYALGQCPEPVISTTGGEMFYHKGNQVSIAYDCAEGVVHYTTDGSEPTKDSSIYTAPFTTDESMVVKAKAFSDNYFDSEVVIATLTREWEAVATPVISAAESFTGSKTKVELACATEGALIRYTTDGSEPNSHSKRYSGPFEVCETTTVKAYAILADYLDSEVATKTITKVWGIGDSVGLPDHQFSTGVSVGWIDDNGEAMKSGAITHNQQSVLKSTFVGKGMLSFALKLSCEEDEPPEYIEYDHYELWIDGELVIKLDGVHDWKKYSYNLEEGEHVVEWRYVKDNLDDQVYPGEDCVWVKDVVWMPERTQTSEVKVETTWLKTYFPTLGSYYFDYEEKANDTAANGINKVWEVYLIGLDPTDSAAKFVSSIAFEDGKPVVSWDPDLGGARAYTILGSTDLKTWTKVEEGRASDYNFFKVTVEMK